jgi:hypothetical protein
VVHLIRAAMRFVSWHDRKAVAAALKPIYQAADADTARIELEAFKASELGRKNPHTVAVFDNAWERFTPFLAFPPMLRRVIYTTNSIESLNYQLRKIIKNRGHFPNDDAVIKLLWLAICSIEDKRGPRPRQGSRPAPRRQTQSRRAPGRRPNHHQLETSPRPTRPHLSRPNQPPPMTEASCLTQKMLTSSGAAAERSSAACSTCPVNPPAGCSATSCRRFQTGRRRRRAARMQASVLVTGEIDHHCHGPIVRTRDGRTMCSSTPRVLTFCNRSGLPTRALAWTLDGVPAGVPVHAEMAGPRGQHGPRRGEIIPLAERRRGAHRLSTAPNPLPPAHQRDSIEAGRVVHQMDSAAVAGDTTRHEGQPASSLSDSTVRTSRCRSSISTPERGYQEHRNITSARAHQRAPEPHIE